VCLVKMSATGWELVRRRAGVVVERGDWLREESGERGVGSGESWRTVEG